MQQENSGRSIDLLISDLGNRDGMVRQRARHALTQIGEKAGDALIRAFQEKTGPAHYEAAKALSLIGSIKAIATFIEALKEDDFSVRWVAAEGLIAVGRPAILQLLKALDLHSESIWLRDGTHHVLHDLVGRKLIDAPTKKLLLPVLEAYQEIDPVASIRAAVTAALDRL